MNTAERLTYQQLIPNWGLETLMVIADTHRLVADIERGLRYAVHLQAMNPRVGDKLQPVHDALGVVQVSLSALELTAHQLFSEIAEGPQLGDGAAPGA